MISKILFKFKSKTGAFCLLLFLFCNLSLKGQLYFKYDTPLHDELMDFEPINKGYYISIFSYDFTDPGNYSNTLLEINDSGEIIRKLEIAPVGKRDQYDKILIKGDTILLFGSINRRETDSRFRILKLDRTFTILSDKIYGRDEGGYRIKEVKKIEDKYYVVGGSGASSDNAAFFYSFDSNLNIIDSVVYKFGSDLNLQAINDFIITPQNKRFLLFENADPLADTISIASSTSYLVETDSSGKAIASSKILSTMKKRIYTSNNQTVFGNSNLNSSKFLSIDDTLVKIVGIGQNNQNYFDDNSQDYLIVTFNHRFRKNENDIYIGTESIRDLESNQPILHLTNNSAAVVSSLIFGDYYDSTKVSIHLIDSNYTINKTSVISQFGDLIAFKAKATKDNNFGLGGSSNYSLFTLSQNRGFAWFMVLDSNFNLPNNPFLSIKNQNQATQLSAFPNPISPGNTIRFSASMQDEEFEFYSIDGKKVHHDILVVGNSGLEIPSNLQPGVYILKSQNHGYIKIMVR